MIAQLQQSASVKEFISDAVQSGKVVTIHEKTLSMSGWTGAGYSVIDPDTGAGGYLIEGKGNGGFLPFLSGLFSGLALGALSVLLGTAFPVIWLILLFVVVLAVTLYNLNVFDDPLQAKCFGVGWTIGVAMSRLGASIVGASIKQLIERTILFFMGVGVGGTATKANECLS